MFFFFLNLYLRVKTIRRSLFSAGKARNIFTVPAQRYTSAPALCPKMVWTEFSHLPFPQDIMLAHYMDGIMMMGSDEQEVATTLDTLVRQLHARDWEINPTHKNLWPVTSVNVLGVQ